MRLRLLPVLALLAPVAAAPTRAQEGPVLSFGRARMIHLRELPEGWRHQGRTLHFQRRAVRDGTPTRRVAREGLPVGFESTPLANELVVDLELRGVTSASRTLEQLRADPGRARGG